MKIIHEDEQPEQTEYNRRHAGKIIYAEAYNIYRDAPGAVLGKINRAGKPKRQGEKYRPDGKIECSDDSRPYATGGHGFSRRRGKKFPAHDTYPVYPDKIYYASKKYNCNQYREKKQGKPDILHYPA